MANELVAGFPIAVQREIIDRYGRRRHIMNFVALVLAARIGEIRAVGETQISLRRGAVAYRGIHISVGVGWKRVFGCGEVESGSGFLKQLVDLEFRRAAIT